MRFFLGRFWDPGFSMETFEFSEPGAGGLTGRVQRVEVVIKGSPGMLL